MVSFSHFVVHRRLGPLTFWMTGFQSNNRGAKGHFTAEGGELEQVRGSVVRDLV